MKAEKLIEKYFYQQEEDDNENQPQICSVKWCTKEAYQNDLCESHYNYARNGVYFNTELQEKKYLKKAKAGNKGKKNFCCVKYCYKRTTNPNNPYCRQHTRQLKKYGYILHLGGRKPFVTKHGLFFKLHFYSFQTASWNYIAVDKKDVYKVSCLKLIFSESIKSCLVANNDGTYTNLKQYIYGDGKSLPIIQANGDWRDFTRKNLIQVSTTEYKLFNKKIGKAGIKCIFRNPYTQRWYFYLRLRESDIRIFEKFRTKREAKRFRDRIFITIFGNKFLNLIRKQERYYGRD